MQQDDAAYYRARAEEERAMTKASKRADIAAVHLQLALEYEELAKLGNSQRTLRTESAPSQLQE